MTGVKSKENSVSVLGCPEAVTGAAPLMPFDDGVIDFFNDLSKALMREREYSDVATFGFWCRKASLLAMKEAYDDLAQRLGRGVVFHSTPSNVPVNFAFSFASGLLAGNANIVRLPGKDFEQVKLITAAVKDLLDDKYKDMAPYISFVKYPPDKELHDTYSSVCDVRVIWGGDGTIEELRQSPLKPRATEITFADRNSIAAINADEYIKAEDKQKIAQDFYNDTYFTDQNACTAPRIVFWLGNDKSIESAKEIFWINVHTLAKERYTLAPVQAVGKLAAFYKAAASKIKHDSADSISFTKTQDNYVTRICVTGADTELMEHKYNSGYFYEQNINRLAEIIPVCNERLQTLTYYGIAKDEIAAFISQGKPKGIDRAVPIGKSMDFTLTWDGYDLIRQMSRKVVIG